MWFMTIRMNWIKALKVLHTETGSQGHDYNSYYCIIIIVTKMRRLKPAIHMKWQKCWLLPFLSYRQFHCLFKKKKQTCTHFFFHSRQMGNMATVSKKASLPATLKAQLPSLGLSFPICLVGGGG